MHRGPSGSSGFPGRGYRLDGTPTFGTIVPINGSGSRTTIIRPNITAVHTPIILPLNNSLLGSVGIPNAGYGGTLPATAPPVPIPLLPQRIGTSLPINLRNNSSERLGATNESSGYTRTLTATPVSVPIIPSSIQTPPSMSPLPIDETKEEIPTTCTICLCDYGTDESEECPVRLSCGHYFGSECIKHIRNPNCPTCRVPVTGLGIEVQKQLMANKAQAEQSLILKDKIVNEANGVFIRIYDQMVESAVNNRANPRYDEINDEMIQDILSALNPNQLIEMVADYDAQIVESYPFQVLCYNLWLVYDHALGLDQAQEIKNLGSHILADPLTFRWAVTDNLVNNLLYITVQDMLLKFVLETREEYGKEALMNLL